MIKPVNDSGKQFVEDSADMSYWKISATEERNCLMIIGEGFGSPVLCLAGVIQLELVLQIVYAYHNLPKFPMMFRLIVD